MTWLCKWCKMPNRWWKNTCVVCSQKQAGFTQKKVS